MKKICIFPECGKAVKGRGLCTGHIKQDRKGQELRPLQSKVSDYGSAENYYEAKVVRNSQGCWDWTGEKTPAGYGTLTKKYGRTLIHRYAYSRWVEKIPDGYVIDHLCYNTSCSNPEHLRAVTQKQNMENRKQAQSNSTTGVLGVHITASGKYRARIKHHRKEHHLGTFEHIEDAEKAYLEAKRRLFSL